MERIEITLQVTGNGRWNLITCRNKSYYGFLGRIMERKCLVSVPKCVVYVVNTKLFINTLYISLMPTLPHF